MGQGQSQEPRQLTAEQLGHELALRFATKCYTHLEIAHYKDIFKSLADHQDDIEYWKEETFHRFLCLPDAIEARSVLYAMATFLGAFPFPSLAPAILTREAMLKVVTIMTERYGKILKRGKQDRLKLLFRSLAVFDRSQSQVALRDQSEKEKLQSMADEQKPIDSLSPIEGVRSHVAGFAIDEPIDDDEEEDDDELALSALDALDAIEVFKLDNKRDRKINHAKIPVANLRKLLMLMLVLAPLGPQEHLAIYSEGLDQERIGQLRTEVEALIAAFDPEDNGISYKSFIRASSSMPHLFDPLSPLFEHFLFSKNLDITKGKSLSGVSDLDPARMNPIMAPESGNSVLLINPCLAHISTFLNLSSLTSSSSNVNLFHNNARFHPLYSTASHGTSLSSFERHVLSWQAPSMLLVSGTVSDSRPNVKHVYGVFLPQRWPKASRPTSSDTSSSDGPRAILFQLQPRHAIFPQIPYHRNANTPLAYLSTKTGIAFGCVIPPSSRSNAPSQVPILGPVSLRIGDNVSEATFQHDSSAGSGAFMPDPSLEAAQRRSRSQSFTQNVQSMKVIIDIDVLEVWGIEVKSSLDGESEAEKQNKRMEWEEKEAERRKGVNFGGDKDGARHLLEMAGIVGQNRSGGSVG